MPVPEWDAWLAAHPDARTVHVFQGLLQEAEADPARALALTDFVTQYVDSLTAPPEADLALTDVRGRAWKVRAQALLSAGDHAGASQASERSDAIYRTEPLLRPRRHVPPTEANVRRAEELIEKYGWHHLRDKR